MEQTEIKVVTPNCFHCGKPGYVEMTKDQFDEGKKKLKQGAYYADAFPFLAPEIVEMFISGTHPECWKNMFPEEED